MAMVDSDTDTARGPLMLRLSPRPMPGWDMVDSAMDTERGPLMLRLSHGWDTVDSTATVVLVLVMVVTEVTALDTATERGPLMLRLSHGWDTVDSTATVVLALAMAVMAMVDSDTDMARGPLMLRLSPRPMPGWDMVDSTDMARGLLMLRLSPSTDMVAFTATDSQLMAATAMDLDSMARSNQNQIPRLTIS